MPDYLGADQRKVRKEEDKEEKPIQGNFLDLFFCSNNFNGSLS